MTSFAKKLSEPIVFQRRATGQDTYGQPLDGWEDVGPDYAWIKDITGRQYVAAQAGQNAVQTEITIWYRDDVMPAMRVLHGSVIYDIEAVLGQDRRTLTLMCVKGLSNG